jgi:protein-S-isoprenylcysteine O-methyltransferase Ste14
MRQTWFGIALVIFMIFVSMQRLLETFARRPTIEGDRMLRWSFPLMMVIHSTIFAGTLVEYFLVNRAITYWVTAIGLMLYFGSLVLRNAAIRTLGRYFSLHIEIRKEHTLIKEGVYGALRHPIYSAVIVELISVPLVANAYYTVLFTIVVYLPLLFLRLQREEMALIKRFGDNYAQYRRDVGALVPKWSALCRFGRASHPR